MGRSVSSVFEKEDGCFASPVSAKLRFQLDTRCK